ncbi:MAG: NINE protein [Desulfuromonadales bacterium]|nr:NINE protein [Desulfuromonadales bacterium]NIS42136.1 NINE protein [Desulfuromonadales bacterium]
MSTVQVQCPHCSFSKAVDREKVGAGNKKVTCPECSQHFAFSLDDDDFRFQAAGPAPPNKVALLVITFFLGGLGGHKFYLRKYLQGVLYLLFCWTAIPSLIALVEFIIYCFKSEEQLQQQYA